jgi:hypothetical protein
MLSFHEKLAIADSFPELQRKDVSLGRVNYHYDQSVTDKKTVLYHLHPNGNGYVYVGELHDFVSDSKGFVNIRDVTAAELRSLIGSSIRSLSMSGTTPLAPTGQAKEEQWKNREGHTLALKFEDEDQMWYIYSGLNLDSAFDTYEEAKEYLEEEGFERSI